MPDWQWDEDPEDDGWTGITFPVSLDLDIDAEDLAFGFHIEHINQEEDDDDDR